MGSGMNSCSPAMANRREISRRGPPSHLHVYGPTEATTFATWYEIRATAARVPIGRPIRNPTASVPHRSPRRNAGNKGSLTTRT